MRRVAVVILLVVAGAVAAPAPATAAEPRASLTDIEDEVMCPICGTPLNLAAAPQAERERAFIRRLIARGETKQEIMDALVREYGPEVLATPEGEGFDLAAWVVPAAALLLAALALGFAVRRWRRRGTPAPGAESRLDPDEDERLRSDLARYDL
jgi:cytochrome c-type biogenesis protein CcmH/NrfF